jgi:plasmid stability protein
MREPTRKPRLSIEVDAELRRELKVAAAERDVSVREYVLAALRQALAAEERRDWSRMSEPAFAREWDSDADSEYDRL